MVLIEIDGPRNECLIFRPLGKRLRGRMDLMRDTEPQARLKSNEFPLPIPGLQIGWDDAGAFVAEPLQAPEHAALKERITRDGFKLGPARQAFPCDESTWCFWMQRACEAGLAKVVEGKFGKLPGIPRKDFLNPVPQADNRDKLTQVLEKLLERLK
jgi:hypothetical protein